MFSNIEAIDSANPFTPSEPNLSRLPLARFPPPHTAENVLAQILRNENPIPVWMRAELYDCEVLGCIWENEHLRIMAPDGPGSSVDKTLMCSIVDPFDELDEEGWQKARAVMDAPEHPSDKYLRYKGGDVLWVSNKPFWEGTAHVQMAINPEKDPSHRGLIEHISVRLDGRQE